MVAQCWHNVLVVATILLEAMLWLIQQLSLA